MGVGSAPATTSGAKSAAAAVTRRAANCAPITAKTEPWHVHQHDDEAFYVLPGTVHLYCGDQTWHAGAGAFVLLPRHLPPGATS
ncbi:cupin domain-containing protein [Nonomuraea sp. NPDC046570]|uniref:cupin domain-containing protein n=1 Tax=Nonomuraea sp. NPDC046570 TaxID=3155255 RepID=UPI0033EF21B8